MDGGFESDPPRQQRITDALDRLSRLIDQLLTLARAEAGVSDRGPMVPVDLARLVEMCASDFVDQAVAARIDLGFQLDPTPLVNGVPVLLGELLRNLVDNALRHCPPGSNVTVASGARGGRPWIAVEDDGPGIAPDQRGQMFARFQRGSTTSAEGSGLGLAIVKEIATLHGAEVEVSTSSDGKGARFELAWPWRSQSPGRRSSPMPSCCFGTRLEPSSTTGAPTP
jgi:two-component system sensor histidine kinase TctE